MFEPGVGHLCGDGALPDQVVECVFLAGNRQGIGGPHFVASGANGLVGFLRAFGFGGVAPGLIAEVFVAVEFSDTLARGGDRLVAQIHRIGTHIGNVAVFVEGLGCAHRLLGSPAQLAVGLLLQCAGDERGRGRALGIPLLHAGDDPRALQQPLAQFKRGGFVQE